MYVQSYWVVKLGQFYTQCKSTTGHKKHELLLVMTFKYMAADYGGTI